MLVNVPSSEVGAVHVVFPTLPTVGVGLGAGELDELVGVAVGASVGDGEALAIAEGLAVDAGADALGDGAEEADGPGDADDVATAVAAADEAVGLLVGGTIRGDTTLPPPHPAATATTASEAIQNPAARTFITYPGSTSNIEYRTRPVLDSWSARSILRLQTLGSSRVRRSYLTALLGVGLIALYGSGSCFMHPSENAATRRSPLD